MELGLTLIADLLLIAAALGAGVYCLILSRRLTRLSSIDQGLGGAIAVLSAQVDDMHRALEAAKSSSESAVQELHKATVDARDLAGDLEMMIAACHDLAPMADAAPPAPSEPAPSEPAPEAPSGAATSPASEVMPVFRHRSTRLGSA